MNILDQIIKTKREEVAERKRKISIRDLETTLYARRQRLSMREALARSPLGIIAEFKRKSPSQGWFSEEARVTEVVGGYARSGAAVCSVLTDTTYFGGSLLDLALARERVSIPLLRKDFVVDSYQVAEAAAYGADAILLIASVLSPRQCRELTEAAHTYQLEVLLEVHEEHELEQLGEVDMVGVNNRNLSTFQTDVYTSFHLAKKLPGCYLKVAESGIHSMLTLKALREVGYKGFLIGEHFMKEKQPAQALQKFIDHAD